VESACGREGMVPCLEVGRAHHRKLRLCDSLEELADTLPSRLDRLACLRIANELVPILRDSHRYEEDIVFPAFVSGSADAAASILSVHRLMAEHIEDECAAQDVTDMLLAIGHGGPVNNPEALGFMLRALFETLRRHIAFELEHVFPVKAKALPAPPSRQSSYN
jgi:iron-sulfur cluster repair protein YtfE (RIC family)